MQLHTSGAISLVLDLYKEFYQIENSHKLDFFSSDRYDLFFFMRTQQRHKCEENFPLTNSKYISLFLSFILEENIATIH